jgi:thiol-disulfide isomerase/thioredoxin
MDPVALPVCPASQEEEALVDVVACVSSFLAYWAESLLTVWLSYGPSLVLFPHTSCHSCPATTPVMRAESLISLRPTVHKASL